MLPMTGRPGLRLLMTADAVGGVWTYALDLADGLARHGVETVLVAMGPRAAPDQLSAARRIPRLRLVETDLPLEWLAGSAAEIQAAGTALARLAAESGAEIVQLNAPGPAADVTFPVPVVVACHSCLATWWRRVRGGELPADFAWRVRLAGRGYRAATALVAPSRAFAGDTRIAYGLRDAPVAVHNARRCVDVPAVQGMPPFAFTAGRLWDEGKDAATLDRAAGRIGMPMLAAGPMAAPHGGDIRFAHLRPLGRLSSAELAGWLAARPIFASAARYEPFGLTVLEAALAGCPLVLADTPVFRELWDGAASFAPAGDAVAFADAIDALAGDGERRAALGVAAKERACRYSPDAQSEAMLKVYRRALSGAGHQAGREAAA